MSKPLTTLQDIIGNLPIQHRTQPVGDLVDPNQNYILHMDNADAIAHIPPGSIDFLYIDPPFASNATYRQQISIPGHTIERTAYTDVWPNGLSSYLEFLVPRLAQMKSLLSSTGSICVHLDNHSYHYVKIAMDAIFGSDRLINEIIWRYGKMSNTSRRFPQNHDTLLVYAASDDWYFKPVLNQPSEYRTRFLRDLTGNQVLYGTVKYRVDKLITRRIAAKQRELGRELLDNDVLFDFDVERKVQDDVFTDISIVRGNAREGTGYDTQKPQKLLERLIGAFCPPDGVVADLFCGSGTTGAAASALNRRWILADVGLPAIQTTRLRLRDTVFEFVRDPALAPSGFTVDADGRIRDFRIADLDLSESDLAAILHCLHTAPEALIAGEVNGNIIDVFGREAAPNL